MNVKEAVREYYNSWNEIPPDHHGYIFHIPQNIAEMESVCEYLKDRKFDSFVELGVDRGGSLFVYSNVLCADNAKIWAVDTVIRPDLRFIIEKLKKKFVNTTFIQNHSHNLAPIFNESVELLHIDAGHSYNPGIKVDWDAWYPKVKSGGVILLHDTLDTGHDGPPRLRKELEQQGFNIKTFGDWHACGISVIIKK